MENADDSTERRKNYVALPGPAIKAIATLAVALTVGVTSVLWNIIIDHNRVIERVDILWAFGPETGGRFTKNDGKKIEGKQDEIHHSLTDHIRKPYHDYAGKMIDALIAGQRTCEEDLRSIRAEIARLRSGK